MPFTAESAGGRVTGMLKTGGIMSMIEWCEEFSVNVEEIDNQHKFLLKLLNDLNTAIESEHDRHYLAKTLHELIAYTRIHFGTEEKYFEKFDYPDKEDHIEKHNYFIAKLTEFQSEFEKGTVGLSYEVLAFLTEWLFGHISVVDKRYSEFFNENGLR